MKVRFCCLLIGIFTSLSGFATAGGGFVFLADSTTGDQGTQVVVPIRALGFDSIISIQGTIGFDSSRLAYVGLQSMGLPSMTNSNFGTLYIAHGRLTFSWNESNLTPISVPDSTVLFAVVFQITGPPGDQVPIAITNTPTLLEVVDWSYTPIAFTARGGNVQINVPPVCEIPDSLRALNITQTHATLSWVSANAGAAYWVEWGPWGYQPGNGIGSTTGTSVAGQNTVTVSTLAPTSTYEFYVREQCDPLNTVNAGPAGFATLVALPVHDTVIVYGDSVQDIQNATVTARIHVIRFTDILSTQGSVTWDPAVATLTSANSFALPNFGMANFGMTQVAVGKITFSWNDPTLLGVSLADSATLFGLQFTLVGAPGSLCDVNLPDLPLVMELVDVSFAPVPDSAIPGRIRILGGGVGIASATMQPTLDIYPNPLAAGSDQFHLCIHDANTELQSLTLVNALGQKLENAVAWTREGNQIRCTISPVVTAGLWFLQVQTDAGAYNKELLIYGK
jgi:hypothetical protein